MDPEPTIKKYGAKSTFDNHLATKSRKIKEEDFKKKTEMCGRITRSLVKDRDRFFTVAMKPTLPTAYEVN